MNSDITDRFLARAEQALRFSGGNSRQSETSFLQHLMSALDLQAYPPGISPAGLLRSFLGNSFSIESAHNVLDLLATPSQRPRDALRAGDWMLRFVPGTGDLGHISVLASDDLLTQPMLASAGIISDGTQPGYYGLVIEAGAFPHDRQEPFARRFLDARGRVPAHTVLVRPVVAESDICSHQTELLDSEDDAMTGGASQACYSAFSMAGPGFASALGMIAHVMIESDAEKTLKVERGAQLFVDDQARGSLNPRMVRFLLSKNPNLSANDKDIIGQGGYRRPDFILHDSKRQEFDEIKSNSDAGRKAGLAQLKEIAAWMRARGLPYAMGSSYLQVQEKYIPVLTYRVAGLPVEVLLKVERLQSGLILYQYCIRADLTKLVKRAIVGIFILLMAFLIRYVRLPISLPKLPIRLPPGAPDIIVIPPIKQPVPLEVTDILTSSELRIAHEHFGEEQVRDLTLLVEPESLFRNGPADASSESDGTNAMFTWDILEPPTWLKIEPQHQRRQESESWGEPLEPANGHQGCQCHRGTTTDALPASHAGSWDIEAVPVVLPPARTTAITRAGFRPDVSVLCTPPPVILERFEFDGTRPKAALRTRIGTLAQEIVDSQPSADPVHSLCILGHTDDIGSEADNQELGARRALAVSTELEAALESRQPGLAATLGLTIESRGEEAPMVPNDSTAHRLRNRRVEIFLNRRWRRTTPAVGACPTLTVGPDPTTPTPFAVGEDSFSATISLFGASIAVSGTVMYPADSAGSATPFASALTTPAPLVVFAHGNHATFHDAKDRFREGCSASSGFVAIENHRGYEYLQRVLAGMGMVAISINANVTNCSGLSPTNIQYRGALSLAAIQHFQGLNAGGGSRFVGKLDLAKIALFGHSRGAEAVLVAAETLPTLASLSAAKILGVLSLAPTDAGATSGKPSGFAFMTILPAADGDVSDNFGAKFYDQAIPSPFKCQVYIDAANHNFFNRNWPLDEGHGAVRLSRTEHETILLAYACSFFRGLLLGHNTLRFLRVDVLPPGVPADKVHVSFEAAGATTVEDHENRNISINTLGAPTTQSGGLTAAEFDFQQGVLSSFNRSFFGKTVGMVARTSLAGGLFRSQLPAPINFTNRELWLRVGEVYDGAAVPTTGTGYQIGLEDSKGGTSFGDSDDVGGLPRPFDRRSDDMARIGIDLTKTMLTTQRFSAACFVRSGFDPTHVRAVLIRLDRGDGRALAFDQLQIV